MEVLDKLLKRKKPKVKNPVFVEAGRRGGIRSGEVRRAKVKQKRSTGADATKVAVEVAALLKTPTEPGFKEPIEPTASPPIQMERVHTEEAMEEGVAPESPVLSSLERTLEEAKAELSFIKQVRERTEAELRDIKRIMPSPQLIDKAREELEDVKYIFTMPYTVGILENLSKRGAGKVKTLEEIERGIEASRKEERDLREEVKRILG